MKAAELSKRLSASAENVCRYYLSNSRKNGRYWTVGNAHNEKGKSLIQVVEIKMFNKNQARERVVIDEQIWKYNEETGRWQLHSGLPDPTKAR